MKNAYELRLMERMDRIEPGAYEKLSTPQDLPEGVAEAVLRELLETGCLSQNAANIEAARRAFSRLPPKWVKARLPKVAPACLFREREWQEWEFRRAVELLGDRFPDAAAWLAEYAAGLCNPEVEEALRDVYPSSPG